MPADRHCQACTKNTKPLDTGAAVLLCKALCSPSGDDESIPAAARRSAPLGGALRWFGFTFASGFAGGFGFTRFGGGLGFRWLGRGFGLFN